MLQHSLDVSEHVTILCDHKNLHYMYVTYSIQKYNVTLINHCARIAAYNLEMECLIAMSIASFKSPLVAHVSAADNSISAKSKPRNFTIGMIMPVMS